jgi:hypothetical protein
MTSSSCVSTSSISLQTNEHANGAAPVRDVARLCVARMRPRRAFPWCALYVLRCIRSAAPSVLHPNALVGDLVGEALIARRRFRARRESFLKAHGSARDAILALMIGTQKLPRRNFLS